LEIGKEKITCNKIPLPYTQTMRGKKTSVIDTAEPILKLLKKNSITDISYGIIISVKDRKDHRTSIKITPESGCLLMTLTGKRYKQELRIYGILEKEEIERNLKKELGEQYRIL
jgi:hypothetical protein